MLSWCLSSQARRRRLRRLTRLTCCGLTQCWSPQVAETALNTFLLEKKEEKGWREYGNIAPDARGADHDAPTHYLYIVHSP